MANFREPWYLSLLGLAEHFRSSTPPNIKLCIHCLQTILTFKPPIEIEARTYLQLGSILYNCTKNTDLSRNNLQKAWDLSHSHNIDSVRFESASKLAHLLGTQCNLSAAKPILHMALESAQQYSYWYCRLIFQLAQIYAHEKDHSSACKLLSLGVDYTASKGPEYRYTKTLFLLSQGMVQLINKKLPEVHNLMAQSMTEIEEIPDSQTVQKESLKVFLRLLQVCHYLMEGQVKSVKPALKQLQQSVQTLSFTPSTEYESLTDVNQLLSCDSMLHQFHWLPKEHLGVLVCLVTVMHSLQIGHIEKAQKFTDKALSQIEKLKSCNWHPILSSLQIMLLEHIIMCRLITGNKSTAIQEIVQTCHLCEQQPRLMNLHNSQIHTLLGLYAMSMNCMESAEAQFNSALEKTKEPSIRAFINLNKAIVYLRTNREGDLIPLLERLDPEKNESLSHSLRAAAFYVKGLQSFFKARYNEAKRYLRETLKMANAEDLNRLTSCSLVLLGHIFLALDNSQEALNMVTPAMQLASKIPDIHVQLWAAALLKDLYRLRQDPQGQAQGTQLHDSFSQTLLNDHFKSSQQPEHRLIQWTTGPFPMQALPPSNSQPG